MKKENTYPLPPHEAAQQPWGTLQLHPKGGLTASEVNELYIRN